MSASIAASVGLMNAVGSITGTEIPLTRPAIAVFMADTMSPTIELVEPVHWYLQPSRAQASAAPYWVGTKNGFVVT
jgi:hypothetical protein